MWMSTPMGSSWRSRAGCRAVSELCNPFAVGIQPRQHRNLRHRESGNYERQVYTYQFLKNGVETAALRQPQEVAGYFFSHTENAAEDLPVRWPLPEISS